MKEGKPNRTAMKSCRRLALSYKVGKKKEKNWIGPNESAYWRSGRRGIWNKVLYTYKHGWDTDKVINPKSVLQSTNHIPKTIYLFS